MLLPSSTCSRHFWQMGKTLCERGSFEGPIIPFGALVEYHPTSAKDELMLRQFGKKVLPGMFLGYALYGGENLEG